MDASTAPLMKHSKNHTRFETQLRDRTRHRGGSVSAWVMFRDDMMERLWLIEKKKDECARVIRGFCYREWSRGILGMVHFSVLSAGRRCWERFGRVSIDVDIGTS